MIRTRFLLCLVLISSIAASVPFAQAQEKEGKLANKPLYRDPVFDGAADPVVIWLPDKKCWLMFYTSRVKAMCSFTGMTGTG